MAAVLSPGPADVQVRAALGPRSQPGRLDSASTPFWLFCHSLAWTRQDWGAQRLQVQVKGWMQGWMVARAGGEGAARRETQLW